MKLLSFNVESRDRIGIALSEDRILDLASVPTTTPWPEDMMSLVNLGQGALDRLAVALREGGDFPGVRTYAASEIAWNSPIPNPSKIVCIAANNRALDAVKLRSPVDHPAFFTKPWTVLVGHGRPIQMRKSYGLTHAEPELAVIVGKLIRQASPAEAFDAVFGYSIFNDVTSVGMREEDSFSLRVFIPDPESGELKPTVVHTTYPGRYKGADTFGPLGPVIVTKDEIPDPAALTITCRLDDTVIAQDSTRNYVWDVANALSQISQTSTLLPGDIVAMGTATDAKEQRVQAIPGVLRQDLNGFKGIVSVEISGIGTLRNPIENL